MAHFKKPKPGPEEGPGHFRIHTPLPIKLAPGRWLSALALAGARVATTLVVVVVARLDRRFHDDNHKGLSLRGQPLNELGQWLSGRVKLEDRVTASRIDEVFQRGFWRYSQVLSQN